MAKIFRREFCDSNSINDLQTAMSLFRSGLKGENVIVRDSAGHKVLSEEFQKNENGRTILVLHDYLNKRATQIAAEGENGWWVRDASILKPPTEEIQMRQV